MEEGNYEQEEQQIDEMMDQKLSFLDSFLSEDKDAQQVEDNVGNETQEQTTCSGVNSSNSNCNCNNDNCDNDVLLDKYIESECGLNKKTKAKTLKEMLLYHNNKNIKRNKHELIESKYGFTTEHAIFTIAVMFVLLILYVLHLLYFVLIVLSFGVLVYMLHINKPTILKHKHKLIEYLQRKQTTSYAHLRGNMNELSEIQPDADNYYYDDEQTQTLIHI